jgi:uncharacterized OB-fold protein
MEQRPFNHVSFQAFLGEHKLMGSRCARDGKVFLPPRGMCSEDFGDEMEWVELSGRGRLAAFSVIYIGPGAMTEAGYDRKNPYCTAIIELEEGPKISGQLVEVDVLHPETISIGMPVQVTYLERGEGDRQQTQLGFRPA